jgi:hypothetical protein
MIMMIGDVNFGDMMILPARKNRIREIVIVIREEEIREETMSEIICLLLRLRIISRKERSFMDNF